MTAWQSRLAFDAQIRSQETQEENLISVGKSDRMVLTTTTMAVMTVTSSTTMAALGWDSLSQAGGATTVDLLILPLRGEETGAGLCAEMDLMWEQEGCRTTITI